MTRIKTPIILVVQEVPMTKIQTGPGKDTDKGRGQDSKDGSNGDGLLSIFQVSRSV
jgi:hypothetical protein